MCVMFRNLSRIRSRGVIQYVLPAGVFVTVFLLWPILEGLWTSIHVAGHLGGGNYATVVESGQLVGELIVTLLITVASVLLAVTGAVSLALLLNSRLMTGRKLARSFVVIPWAVPAVVVGLLWSAALSPSFGFVDYVLHVIGVMSRPWSWLTNPSQATGALVIVRVWQYLPIGTVFITAALQAVDLELYGAAKIDGASWRQQLRHVTLPGIRPTLSLVVVLLTVWIFRGFAVIDLLTGGGPGTSTTTLVLGVYQNAFTNLNFGTATALGTITIVLSGLLSLGLLWALREREPRGRRRTTLARVPSEVRGA